MSWGGKLAVSCAIAVITYFALESGLGRWRVRQLCSIDGGLQILETTNAKGYLDESGADGMYCLSCFYRLGNHQFEYVDVHIPGDAATENPAAIRPGYYRLGLAAASDPRCRLWEKNVNSGVWARMQRDAGIPTSQCIAVDSLPTRPAGPVVSQYRERLRSSAYLNIWVSQLAIADATGGHLIARVRNYEFVPMWKIASGTFPSAVASCNIPFDTYERVAELEPISDRSKAKATEQ
jgi:hypothetical protein